MSVDIYIKNKNHKDYDETIVLNDNIIDILISKIQVVLFTNKGEILGQPDFGCDIPKLLWQTNINADDILENINEQISIYVPEVANYGYNANFYILPGTIQDIGVIEINLNFTTISAVFK